MWNHPTAKQLATLPTFYSTENISLKDKVIYMHFFFGGCDWYVAEFDGEDAFFGFVILNNDLENAEWGYFILSELASINIKGFEIDRDLYWQPTKASNIERIKKCRLGA
ncbi:DUF2958 domain-containing protein [Desulfovibrio litoralis]|uniref:DUF2958 domain-containing protein n=1 Tax=Desulfovibrio litoralis DSM 11393 TaxID=1121455 RepID=A0A1M7S039_9BACT|nr:DUF2958 domain-containing protein [Desulfovibrio litoralis]SHN51949.1 Protein of unknown function [Desulfovibrio litoralis DSM 11393]